MKKEVESQVLANTEPYETDEKVTALIQTHNALATALEIKNALHTIILQMDETLEWKREQQSKLANLKGMLSKLRNRVDDHLEEHREWELEYAEDTEEPPKTSYRKGESLAR